MQRHRTGRRALRLFALYASASLVPVAALGLVLGLGYRNDARDAALRQGLAQAAVIEQMSIGPTLLGADATLKLTNAQQIKLYAVTNEAMFKGSVDQLRVITFSGRVVFSSATGRASRLDASQRTVDRLRAGHPHAELTGPGADAAHSIRVLQPIISERSGLPIGVLELRFPYQDIARTTSANTREAFVRLGLGLVALYMLLGLISWWTTRALARYAAGHEHRALHDPLTGLPNRALFQRRAERALAASSPERKGGLVLVDLNRFKEVNDTLGHHAGDELLQVIARRLVEAFRSDDVVARLGGDEFAVLLHRVRDEAEALRLLERVRERVRADTVIDGVTLQIDASLGLCLFPDDARDVEELLQRADSAMYEGKRGASSIVSYGPSVAAPDTSSLVLQRELATAIISDELFLEYQPKVDLGGGQVVGVEALVRWQHPERGRLGPDRFVPVAERSSLVDQLTSWVLDRALADCAGWLAEGIPWTVAVNVSARNLSSASFVSEVLAALGRHDVAPEHLVLELTETATACDDRLLHSTVAGLEAAGVHVSLDDFGAGVTSLAQLRTTSISEIKIDRQFVDRLDERPASAAIVGSLIQLGHQLGCTVTAEGVETAAVADWLASHGCNVGQGFHWMRPGPWRMVAEQARDTGRGRRSLAPADEGVPVG